MQGCSSWLRAAYGSNAMRTRTGHRVRIGDLDKRSWSWGRGRDPAWKGFQRDKGCTSGGSSMSRQPSQGVCCKGHRNGGPRGIGAGAVRTHLTDNGAGREKERGWSPATMWDPGELALDEAAMVHLGEAGEAKRMGAAGRVWCHHLWGFSSE